MTKPTGRPHGGPRPGSGRPLNPLKSSKIAALLIERGKRLLGDDAAPTPLDFLLQQLWNHENSFEIRLDAAKAALPYCSPKLQAIAVQSQSEQGLKIEIVDFRTTKQVITNANLVDSNLIDNAKQQQSVSAFLDHTKQQQHEAVEAIIVQQITDDDDDEQTENKTS